MRRRPSVRPRSRGATQPRLEWLESRALLTTFVVDSALDTFSTTFLTLREALIIANDTPGPHRIEFDIPGGGVQRIVLESPLPYVSNEIVIDGTTQPGYDGRPRVEIDGSQIDRARYPHASGLVISEDTFSTSTSPFPVDGSQIIGLSIFGFEDGAILALDADSIALIGNYLGVDATGQHAPGNDEYGAYLSDLTRSVAAANVVGGQPVGIQVGFGSGITLYANRIGTAADGLAPLPNRFGVVAFGTVGLNLGTPQLGGNLISGNAIGAQLQVVDGVLVAGNLIGTNPTGSAALPNTGDGLLILNASNVLVGLPNAGNLISGNGTSGVHVAQETRTSFRSASIEPGVSAQAVAAPSVVLLANRIGTDATGSRPVPNANTGVFIDGVGGVVVGLPGAGNVIAGNGHSNVQVFGPLATGNVIQGNRIGTNADGTAVVGASPVGIFLNNAPGNLVGVAGAETGNVIAGNGTGVLIAGAAARSNTIQANQVGPNGTGVLVLDAPGNLIGGADQARNVVSGNGPFGVRIVGAGATGNVVLGNRIGTNADGTAVIGNGGDGVFLQSPGNVVASNLVAGSTLSAIQVFGVAASGNQIVANRIGADATGFAPLGNVLDGIFINEAPNTLIAGNQIVASGLAGLQLAGTATTGTLVRDNLIGTDPNGQVRAGLGNAYGLFIQTGNQGNTIERSNVIAGSTEFNQITEGPPAPSLVPVGRRTTPARQTTPRRITPLPVRTIGVTQSLNDARRANWTARLLP
jgi:hypothetical protein